MLYGFRGRAIPQSRDSAAVNDLAFADGADHPRDDDVAEGRGKGRHQADDGGVPGEGSRDGQEGRDLPDDDLHAHCSQEWRAISGRRVFCKKEARYIAA